MWGRPALAISRTAMRVDGIWRILDGHGAKPWWAAPGAALPLLVSPRTMSMPLPSIHPQSQFEYTNMFSLPHRHRRLEHFKKKILWGMGVVGVTCSSEQLTHSKEKSPPQAPVFLQKHISCLPITHQPHTYIHIPRQFLKSRTHT